MAGSFADYLEKKILDAVFGQTALPAIATVWLALFTDGNTATQRDANTVVEATGGSYARKSVTNNTTEWPASTGILATKQNANVQTFVTPTAGWGIVTAFGIYDAVTAGNLLGWGDLTNSKTINIGDTVQFAANAITITLD